MSDTLRRVFLSYARADSTALVDRLERDLQARQFQTWVDRHGLEGGDEWLEIIQDAIDSCQALVVIISPAAVQSQWVRMEYRYAREQGKLVIPAKYLSTTRTPIDLHILQWVDFQSSYDEGLRQLVQTLGRLRGPAPAPEPATPKAQPTPGQEIPPKAKEQAPASPREPEARQVPSTPLQAKTPPPTGIEQWLFKGHRHLIGRNYAEALAAFDQAIKLYPQGASGYDGRGQALKGLQRYPEALIAFEKAITLSPRQSSFYLGKAEILDALGRKQEAEQARQKARELGYKG